MPMVGGVKLNKKIRFQDYWVGTGCQHLKCVCTTGNLWVQVAKGGTTITSSTSTSGATHSITLGNITIPEIGSYIPQRANLMVAIREVENDTASVGSLNGEGLKEMSIHKSVDSKGSSIGIEFPDGAFKLPANHHSNNIIIYGDGNVISALNGPGLYLIQFHSETDQMLETGTVILRDFRVGLRIYYK